MKTILIPSDYSANAHHALRFAMYASESIDMKICIFHWTEILIPTSTPQQFYKELYDRQLDEKLTQLKADTAKVLKSLEISGENKHIEYIIKDSSNLDDSLIETVNERKVDLVIMGTHGASGLKKVFFGSNTTRIIDKASVPVIAIPESYPLSPIKKIAYASDLKFIEKEVEELIPFAKMFHASIEIFHVYPSYPQWVDPSPENIEAILAKLEGKFPNQKIKIHVIQTYKENDVVHGIETFVKSFKPDILAMFTVKRTFWDKLFDASRTEEFAFNTSIPLLTLKKE